MAKPQAIRIHATWKPGDVVLAKIEQATGLTLRSATLKIERNYIVDFADMQTVIDAAGKVAAFKAELERTGTIAHWYNFSGSVDAPAPPDSVDGDEETDAGVDASHLTGTNAPAGRDVEAGEGKAPWPLPKGQKQAAASPDANAGKK